ncbi:hypothetical protein B0H15DRAFT_952551 [Mycena belliarum]|uniref:Uncharacterized protein n=1 Tax=Mycena belliarum TaxID=1033014 RepID=A0AAD6TZ49_9AGAR|nr:hypothetical protein B0H15DRAFT_952551 [Mycena belliae]
MFGPVVVDILLLTLAHIPAVNTPAMNSSDRNAHYLGADSSVARGADSSVARGADSFVARGSDSVVDRPSTPPVAARRPTLLDARAPWNNVMLSVHSIDVDYVVKTLARGYPNLSDSQAQHFAEAISAHSLHWVDQFCAEKPTHRPTVEALLHIPSPSPSALTTREEDALPVVTALAPLILLDFLLFAADLKSPARLQFRSPKAPTGTSQLRKHFRRMQLWQPLFAKSRQTHDAYTRDRNAALDGPLDPADQRSRYLAFLRALNADQGSGLRAVANLRSTSFLVGLYLRGKFSLDEATILEHAVFNAQSLGLDISQEEIRNTISRPDPQRLLAPLLVALAHSPLALLRDDANYSPPVETHLIHGQTYFAAGNEHRVTDGHPLADIERAIIRSVVNIALNVTGPEAAYDVIFADPLIPVDHSIAAYLEELEAAPPLYAMEDSPGPSDADHTQGEPKEDIPGPSDADHSQGEPKEDIPGPSDADHTQGEPKEDVPGPSDADHTQGEPMEDIPGPSDADHTQGEPDRPRLVIRVPPASRRISVPDADQTMGEPTHESVDPAANPDNDPDRMMEDDGAPAKPLMDFQPSFSPPTNHPPHDKDQGQRPDPGNEPNRGSDDDDQSQRGDPKKDGHPEPNEREFWVDVPSSRTHTTSTSSPSTTDAAPPAAGTEKKPDGDPQPILSRLRPRNTQPPVAGTPSAAAPHSTPRRRPRKAAPADEAEDDDAEGPEEEEQALAPATSVKRASHLRQKTAAQQQTSKITYLVVDAARPIWPPPEDALTRLRNLHQLVPLQLDSPRPLNKNPVRLHALAPDPSGEPIRKDYDWFTFRSRPQDKPTILAMLATQILDSNGTPLHMLPSASDPNPKLVASETQSLLYTVSYSVWVATPPEVQYEIHRNRCVLIYGCPHEPVPEFDIQTLAQFGDPDTFAEIQDPGMPLGPDEHDITRIGKLRDLVNREARDGNAVLNCLACPLPHKSIPIPPGYQNFATHEIAFQHTQQLGRPSPQMPWADLRWAILARQGAKSDAHQDVLPTWMTVLLGYKIIAIAVRKDPSSSHGDFSSRHGFHNVIRAGTLHWVISITDCIAWGHHGHCGAAIEHSVWCALHNVVADAQTTNAEHVTARFLLLRIWIFWAYQLSKAAPTSFHVPDLKDKQHFWGVLVLASFVILYPALEFKAYPIAQERRLSALPMSPEHYTELMAAYKGILDVSEICTTKFALSFDAPLHEASAYVTFDPRSKLESWGFSDLLSECVVHMAIGMHCYLSEWEKNYQAAPGFSSKVFAPALMRCLQGYEHLSRAGNLDGFDPLADSELGERFTQHVATEEYQYDYFMPWSSVDELPFSLVPQEVGPTDHPAPQAASPPPRKRTKRAHS